MTQKLRPYQRSAVRAVENAWGSGMRRPAVVMATGLGKTRVFATLAEREAKAGGRTLVLAHRSELLMQANAQITNSGRLIAGLDETRGMSTVVASVQTLTRRLQTWPSDAFSMVVIDEAHHASAPTYRRVMEHFGCYEGSARSLGVTATLARTDNRGLADVWDDAVVKYDTAWGIDHGWLVPQIDAKTAVVPDLNLIGIRTVAGDLHQGDLARAVAQSDAASVVAKTYREHATGPDGLARRGIVFCPNVEIAAAFKTAFSRRRIKSAVVTGETPFEVRQQIYAAVRSGEIRVIVNCMVLTEGFDLPAVEVVVIARPTKSAPLYIQMAGRALRASADTGKESALILDVCGRTARRGLATPIDLSLPQEITRTWEQGDIERWDPPPAPSKLHMREIDAISGLDLTAPAPSSVTLRLERWGLEVPEGLTIGDGLAMLAAHRKAA